MSNSQVEEVDTDQLCQVVDVRREFNSRQPHVFPRTDMQRPIQAGAPGP